MSKEKIEKTIKVMGPRSSMLVFPQISVEKYLANEEPKKAPKDPPAHIMPKNLLASV